MERRFSPNQDSTEMLTKAVKINPTPQKKKNQAAPLPIKTPSLKALSRTRRSRPPKLPRTDYEAYNYQYSSMFRHLTILRAQVNSHDPETIANLDVVKQSFAFELPYRSLRNPDAQGVACRPCLARDCTKCHLDWRSPADRDAVSALAWRSWPTMVMAKDEEWV